MPRTSLKLGPGILTLGEGALAIEQQITSIKVQWSESVSGGEETNFLDGTSDAADENASYRAVLAGNVQQDDLAAAGFVAWSWAHKGEEQPFTFQPREDIARAVTGVCVPVPLDLGGDVKVKNRSDFTFRCVGDPVLGDVTP